ncbi:ubiquinol oxidase subunit II [Phenylobacterium sp.]|uniref:ubiquinol oxidase subunit II n=1 Tax=Phenylobacterium sp. TaxID=1871053 RepID=UPI002E2EFDCE|nr:ubiquinol oxidase subunit II [Phenylobacterium sp.]HEX3364495.1 ubiquinol oxidase subunit II [Phenylobacterium sp.]
MATGSPRPAVLRERVAGLMAGTLTLPLGGCRAALLDPQGPVGAAEKTILLNALAIMLAIVVPTILATLGFAWWFRASNTRARYRPQWVYSGRVELVTWSIPILVILFLGGLTWVGSHDLDPARPLKSTQPAVTVEVVSLDWKWLFIYPDQGVASVNQLVVPAGAPLRLKLTSASVMNTFFVPQLGSMIYTMNGMSGQLYLQADKPGVYAGQSSHFSGDGFSGMQFDVRAVPATDFKTWIDRTKAAGPALDEQAYGALSKQSTDVAPYTYRAVSPGLYEDIVQQHLPPAPGPVAAQPASQVAPVKKAS